MIELALMAGVYETNVASSGIVEVVLVADIGLLFAVDVTNLVGS